MDNKNAVTLNLRSLAHIGDAVYEVYVREKTINLTQNAKKLHRYTVALVNAEFQTGLLNLLLENLTHEESELVRRGRNMPVTTSRRVNQSVHRPATAFEILIGHLYLEDKPRLEEIYKIIDPIIEKTVSGFSQN
jgi:ribonuclease-3 family protein